MPEDHTPAQDQTNTADTRTEARPQQAGGKTVATNIIWYIYGFIAALLGLRFILKIFGANPFNAFVDFIYTISGVLSAPFDAIFGVGQEQVGTTEAVFEPSILVAIVVYGLIALGIVKLLHINEPRQHE